MASCDWQITVQEEEWEKKCVCVCVCACMRVCVCFCVCFCVYILVLVWVYMCMCAHKRAHVCVCVFVHACVCGFESKMVWIDATRMCLFYGGDFWEQWMKGQGEEGVLYVEMYRPKAYVHSCHCSGWGQQQEPVLLKHGLQQQAH